MSDKLGTTWKCKAHTAAKHAILQKYLEAWFPILTRQAARLKRDGNPNDREIVFIDGFAGPGEYDAGEPGSPKIAINTAINHTVNFPFPLRLHFVEKRLDRFNHLETVIEPLIQRAQSVSNLIVAPPENGDCDEVLNDLLNVSEHKGVAFGPALAFLDQFGYGAVSMKLVGRIMAKPQCEVFSYLDYKDMNRWITDPNKESTFNSAFGNTKWKECKELPERKRRERLLELYKEALRSDGNSDFVSSFLMFDKTNKPLYWLFFCTNNLRGLEEMKKAMWKVDSSGQFQFSDRDCPDQLDLLANSFDSSWLADELKSRLKGRVLTVFEIKKFVLTETPCYLFKQALKKLELHDDAVSVVNSPPGRRPGTYADDTLKEVSIRFENSLF